MTSSLGSRLHEASRSTAEAIREAEYHLANGNFTTTDPLFWAVYNQIDDILEIVADEVHFEICGRQRFMPTAFSS